MAARPRGDGDTEPFSVTPATNPLTNPFTTSLNRPMLGLLSDVLFLDQPFAFLKDVLGFLPPLFPDESLGPHIERGQPAFPCAGLLLADNDAYRHVGDVQAAGCPCPQVHMRVIPGTGNPVFRMRQVPPGPEREDHRDDDQDGCETPFIHTTHDRFSLRGWKGGRAFPPVVGLPT